MPEDFLPDDNDKNASQKKPNLTYKEGMLELSPQVAFWKAVNLASEDKYEEASKYASKIQENFAFLSAKYLKEDISTYHAPISKRMLANILLKLIILIKSKQSFFDLVNKVNAQVEFSIAVSRNLDSELIKNWLLELLKIKKERGEVLKLIRNMSHESQKLFLEEVKDIALNEVDVPQYVALDILQGFLDDEKTLKIFIKFTDDWDKEVRVKAINALSNHTHIEEVRKAFERALDDERESAIKFLLKKALDKSEVKK